MPGVTPGAKMPSCTGGAAASAVLAFVKPPPDNTSRI